MFVIACSNVANLILARSVRVKQNSPCVPRLAPASALRRTLLAESLLLCMAGAALGLMLADSLVTVAARYAARFSVRALEATVDASVLWLGAGLAVTAAVLLAYVPRLPSSDRSGGLGLAGGGVRITPGTNRRLRIFATTQIACSFVLLAGAGMLVATLTALQTANTGYDMRQYWRSTFHRRRRASATKQGTTSSGKRPRRISDCRRAMSRPDWSCPGATAGPA